MDVLNAKSLVKKYGQEQLLEYFENLTEEQKSALLTQIENLDFSVLENLTVKNDKPLGELTPADALSCAQIAQRKEEFKKAGLNAIREGKVAAVLLAGGQGTRLGLDAPKGTFNVGLTREISIFGQQMSNIKQVTDEAGCFFDIFVMTSSLNDEATRAFFKEKNYFGYDKDRIRFYVQDTAPTCSYDGKIFLEEQYKISTSPNGNGGWYASLIKAGYGETLKENGIEWLNVYAVDNVLQRICDPVFIGATLKSGCACAGKVVKKSCPEERVGVLCKENGAPMIVEYFEMPAALAEQRDSDGELTYRYGVIMNYLFSVSVLNDIYRKKLPCHLASKAIPHIENGVKVTPKEPCGYKFETLAVDIVKLMGSCLAFEVEREREFAPIKNRTGVDSVESARALLALNGVEL